MINSKLTRSVQQQSNEEKLFKLLESIDWKLWEMYNMLKDNLPEKSKTETEVKAETKPATKSVIAKKPTKKTSE